MRSQDGSVLRALRGYSAIHVAAKGWFFAGGRGWQEPSQEKAQWESLLRALLEDFGADPDALTQEHMPAGGEAGALKRRRGEDSGEEIVTKGMPALAVALGPFLEVDGVDPRGALETVRILLDGGASARMEFERVFRDEER